MKIFLMTDLEAVAGVVDSLNWCYPEGRYLDLARELLTREVNAAVDGFLEAGATRIVVCDGHGHGGILPHLLHREAEFIIGGLGPIAPRFGLDESFDAVAWVGQHAMAGTPFNHLAHTGSFEVLEMRANGRAIGEIGSFAYTAAELGVRCIFLSGDQAGCDEAAALIPGIATVPVKWGLNPSDGRDLGTDEARKAHTCARHLSCETARARIQAGASSALKRAIEDPELGRLAPLEPPFEIVTTFREPDTAKARSLGPRRHASSFIACLDWSSAGRRSIQS